MALARPELMSHVPALFDSGRVDRRGPSGPAAAPPGLRDACPGRRPC